MKLKKAETQLDRIENGIAALVHRAYFPMRNAYDGIKKSDELTARIVEDDNMRTRFVESILSGVTVIEVEGPTGLS